MPLTTYLELLAGVFTALCLYLFLLVLLHGVTPKKDFKHWWGWQRHSYTPIRQEIPYTTVDYTVKWFGARVVIPGRELMSNAPAAKNFAEMRLHAAYQRFTAEHPDGCFGEMKITSTPDGGQALISGVWYGVEEVDEIHQSKVQGLLDSWGSRPRTNSIRMIGLELFDATPMLMNPVFPHRWQRMVDRVVAA